MSVKFVWFVERISVKFTIIAQKSKKCAIKFGDIKENSLPLHHHKL
jgi:hypothetical protein